MRRKTTQSPKLTLEQRLDDIINILKELEKDNAAARENLWQSRNYVEAGCEPEPNKAHALITNAIWVLQKQTPLLKRVREHLPNIFRIKVYED